MLNLSCLGLKPIATRTPFHGFVRFVIEKSEINPKYHQINAQKTERNTKPQRGEV